MHLDDMKIFCDVVDTGSFSRAAALNSLTQTAVSRKIQAIEQTLGCTLVDRSRGRRGHLPTPAGQAYYAGCREILARYQDMVEKIGEARGEISGTVRVETVYSVGLHGLARHIKTFLKRFPRAKIYLEYNRSNRIYDDCLTERTDLGIVAYPSEQGRIGVIPLRSDRMVLICAPDHPLSARPIVSFGELGGTPFVAFQKDIPTRIATDRHALEAGVSLDVQMEFDNIETIKRSVEVGLGISVVPQSTVDQEFRVGSLAVVPLEPTVLRPIGIIYKRTRSFTPTAQRFIEVLIESETGSAEPAAR